jgi:hypothetical protein
MWGRTDTRRCSVTRKKKNSVAREQKKSNREQTKRMISHKMDKKAAELKVERNTKKTR